MKNDKSKITFASINHMKTKYRQLHVHTYLDSLISAVNRACEDLEIRDSVHERNLSFELV